VEIKYPNIGICGITCRLYPMYNTEAEGICIGCKIPIKMAVGCTFITFVVKRKKF
jgi:hypothetical protein